MALKFFIGTVTRVVLKADDITSSPVSVSETHSPELLASGELGLWPLSQGCFPILCFVEVLFVLLFSDGVSCSLGYP